MDGVRLQIRLVDFGRLSLHAAAWVGWGWSCWWAEGTAATMTVCKSLRTTLRNSA